MRSTLTIAAFVSFFLTACGVSHSYRTADVSTIPALEGHRMVVPQVMDARDNGQRSEAPSVPGDDAAEELAEVRDAVREHVARAGIVEAAA
ncbi:MAG: hypothetical protein JRH11_13085, partial [Deltaproteobacteria bacterium]|nr:hypothetical protein [Deltaproteobacteria bacterium]